jgi:Protein-tyrosine phosphatase
MSWEPGDGVVELPDGRRVRGRGLRAGDPRGPLPHVGYYLLGRPPAEQAWETEWIRWPDFRLPAEPAAAVATLRQAFDRSVEERVEIACGGGVGRTGTALAVLAVLGGVAPHEAVEWVRARYRPRAVETPWQRRWIASLQG